MSIESLESLKMSIESKTQPKQQVISLAALYDRAAGWAFQARKDDEAEEFRKAADGCRKLAETLPALPASRTRS